MSINTTTTTNIPSILCNSFRFADYLGIMNSFIGYVGPNALRSCTVLTTLNLSNNKITDLAPNAFENNRFLRFLILDDNYLMELPDGIFRPLVHLQSLQINQNFIQIIQTDVFSSHPVLETISLNYNMILALSPAFIDNTAVRNLYMSSNICVSGFFYDLPKANLTVALQRCLDSYAAMQIPTTPLPTPPPGSCSDGNIYDRVCELESIVEELSERINNLMTYRPDPHK
ncbi:chondroadherin-like [Chironomus tepperi]|uniref:chondroadherin-like n=1 Tax=Chironomus tepperi TaxID=113505 RepID=UPI00391F3A0E